MVLRALLNLFKGGSTDAEDGGYYYFVRCSKCGEAIRVRVDRANDLAQEFEDGGDHPSGYAATKGVVGKRCFRTMSLTIRYDRGRRETSRSVDGAEFISREEYEASQGEAAPA